LRGLKSGLSSPLAREVTLRRCASNGNVQTRGFFARSFHFFLTAREAANRDRTTVAGELDSSNLRQAGKCLNRGRSCVALLANLRAHGAEDGQSNRRSLSGRS